MLKFFLNVLIFLNINIIVFSQSDTIHLKEIEINSSIASKLYSENARIIQVISHDEIAQLPSLSLSGILEYVGGVDVRQRGSPGMQADISIHGGTCEQILILVNGIKMNDPQTGHHSMNLPIEVENIERIEILEGPGTRIYGTNAFTGAINIITKSFKDNKAQVAVGVGEHNLYSLSASVFLTLAGIKQSLFISKNSSDGYIKNTDFKSFNIFYQNTFTFIKQQINIQAGYNNKSFGANSFYSAKYPDQFEHTHTLYVATSIKGGKKIKYEIIPYYRRNQDRFELFRNNPPTWYVGHNYHLTHTIAIDSKLYFNSILGKTSLGGEFRNEQIYSNVLGDNLDNIIAVPFEESAYFTKSKYRNNMNIFIEHSYTFNKFSISGGVLMLYVPEFGSKFYGGLDIAYNYAKYGKIYASLNQSVRLPTFTDLYYRSPTNIGNPNLLPEEALTIELGSKNDFNGINLMFGIFRRYGKNLIDWAKLSNNSLWQSMNITKLVTDGIDISLMTDFSKIFNTKCFIKTLTLSYSYLKTSKNSGDYISYYVMDYLKHKATAKLLHKLYGDLNLSWALSYNQRNGTYTEFATAKEKSYPNPIIIDVGLYYKKFDFTLYLEINNATNAKLYDYGNVPLPQRWIKVGFLIDIGLNIGKSKK